MARKKAKIIYPGGKTIDIKFALAKILCSNGDAEAVSERPLVIKPRSFSTYEEELRYLSGKIVNGASRYGTSADVMEFIEQGVVGVSQATTGGRKSIRCRPPRTAIPREEQEFRKYKRKYFARYGDEGKLAADEVMSRRKTA